MVDVESTVLQLERVLRTKSRVQKRVFMLSYGLAR